MNASKWTLTLLALTAAVASCAGVIVGAIRHDTLTVDASIRIQNGPTAATTQCKRTLRVANVQKHDVLNLREQPSSKAAVLLEIAPHTRGLVDLEKQSGAWKRVAVRKDVDWAVGWVHGAYVVDDTMVCPSRPPSTAPAPTGRGRQQDAQSPWPFPAHLGEPTS